jgi:hypothetical protein
MEASRTPAAHRDRSETRRREEIRDMGNRTRKIGEVGVSLDTLLNLACSPTLPREPKRVQAGQISSRPVMNLARDVVTATREIGRLIATFEQGASTDVAREPPRFETVADLRFDYGECVITIWETDSPLVH